MHSHYMQLTVWCLMFALLDFMNSDCSLDSVTPVQIFSLLDLGKSFNCVTPSKEHKFLREHCDNADISSMCETRTFLLAACYLTFFSAVESLSHPSCFQGPTQSIFSLPRRQSIIHSFQHEVSVVAQRKAQHQHPHTWCTWLLGVCLHCQWKRHHTEGTDQRGCAREASLHNSALYRPCSAQYRDGGWCVRLHVDPIWAPAADCHMISLSGQRTLSLENFSSLFRMASLVPEPLGPTFPWTEQKAWVGPSWVSIV